MKKQIVDKRKNLNLVIQRKILRNYDLELIAKDKKGMIRTLFTYCRGDKNDT